MPHILLLACSCSVRWAHSWWYGSPFIIVHALYICSLMISLIIWCENVILDSDILSLALSYTCFEKP